MTEKGFNTLLITLIVAASVLIFAANTVLESIIAM